MQENGEGIALEKRVNVWVFMFVAYGFSWLFWIPDALIAQGLWDAPSGIQQILSGPFNLGPWGPLVAAFVVTFAYQGTAGVKDLGRRGLQFRLGKWWWMILLLFPALIGGALLLAIALGEPVPEFPALAQPMALPIVLVYMFFLTGPLQEEFGWRGVVFENLRGRHYALTAAIVAGLMWGFWHLPLFFVPREEYYYNRPIWGLLLTTTLVGIILAVFYANTRRSVFAAMLGHTMFNWSNYVFPTLGSDLASLILFGFYFIVVAVLLWRCGIRSFICTDEARQDASGQVPV
ncbi:MAG: CPBP family intramembrane glutamic endopeptidase [Caldilineaceae bacterium]|jgi:membrane protease YdiL (CAAX protease family)